jgi:hypothetical protein
MGLIFFILGIVHSVRGLIRTKDYTVRKIFLEYLVEESGDVESDFWASQKKLWETLPDVYSVDVKGKLFLPLPECVKKPVLKIVYVFNNREYIYTTSDLQYEWPPKKVTSMSFVLPYKNAVLMNSESVPVKNITKELNQYAGPRYDFHGAPVPLTDMIDKPFTQIRVTNIMNQQSVIDLGS